MATFHPFTRLPYELRTQIWENSVEPRTIEIGFKKQQENVGQVLHVTTSTPAPAMVQVCREARYHGLYQRAFCTGDEPRYVWANFEIDMISIGHTSYWIINAERLLIRRLKFEGGSDGGFFHSRTHELRTFSNLEEIHIVCEPGLAHWQPAWECLSWPCPRENLRFIDKRTRRMVTGQELDDLKQKWFDSAKSTFLNTSSGFFIFVFLFFSLFFKDA